MPEHDEPVIVAGYAFLFTTSGQTRFVRMSVDEDNDATFDYGTWTLADDLRAARERRPVTATRPSARRRLSIDVPDRWPSTPAIC